MEKKKYYRIIGIGILSLVGLGILFFIGIYFLRSVATNDGDESLQEGSYSMDVDSVGKAPGVSSSTQSPQKGLVLDKTASNSSNEKNIIRRGQVGFSAEDIDKTKDEVQTVIDKYNAEISNSSDQGTGKSREVSIVIKVEEESFDEMLKDLEGVKAEKIFSSVSSEDVTEQVMDLEARLHTYQNTEKQLLEIQKQATNVKDTMEVYKELNEIRYKIEATESQLKYYANQTNYSTIVVSISQSSVGTFEPEEKWKPLGVLKDAIRALGEFGKVLVNLAIWLVVFGIPIGFVVLLVIYLAKKAKK
ncbi:MAG TPA: DUF4349 domain-containing protein [Candidatus Dojkabacteria bacterium]|nr:DUF4349 domain-containing protein [Candidatus Dojkabacteria bacterium]